MVTEEISTVSVKLLELLTDNTLSWESKLYIHLTRTSRAVYLLRTLVYCVLYNYVQTALFAHIFKV